MSQIPKLDRRIVELLEKSKNSKFTVRSLRDQYAKAQGIKVDERSALLRFIYGDVKKLRRARLVEMEGERRKRDQRYHITPQLSPGAVNPNGEVFEEWLERRQRGERADSSEYQPDHNRSTPEPMLGPEIRTFLKERHQKLQVDFFGAKGQLEEYQMLKEQFSEHPEIHQRYYKKYIEARDQMSYMLGRLRTLEDELKQGEYAH